MSHTVYQRHDPVTGQIMRSGFSDAKAEDLVFPDDGLETLLNVEANANTEYVDVATKTIIPRPVSMHITAVSRVPAVVKGQPPTEINIARVRNLPAASHIEFTSADGKIVSTDVTDGLLELTFEDPGSYLIQLRSFPEQDSEITIDVT